MPSADARTRWPTLSHIRDSANCCWNLASDFRSFELSGALASRPKRCRKAASASPALSLTASSSSFSSSGSANRTGFDDFAISTSMDMFFAGSMPVYGLPSVTNQEAPPLPSSGLNGGSPLATFSRICTATSEVTCVLPGVPGELPGAVAKLVRTTRCSSSSSSSFSRCLVAMKMTGWPDPMGPTRNGNALRSAAGWATTRDRFPGRVVDRRPVVGMAPAIIAIRWSTDERRAQTRGASARVRVLSRAPQPVRSSATRY
jgi:hypothetical protein